MEFSDSSTPDDASEAALRKVEEALQNYIQTRPEAQSGELVVNWGILVTRAAIIDGEAAYSTSSYMQPGGMPPSTWVGLLNVEHERWLKYASDTADDSGESDGR